jgi:hypothetical protein
MRGKKRFITLAPAADEIFRAIYHRQRKKGIFHFSAHGRTTGIKENSKPAQDRFPHESQLAAERA